MALLQAQGPEQVLLQARARLQARAPEPGSPERLQARVQARVPERAQPGPVLVQPGPVLQARVQRYPCHRRYYMQQAPTPVQDRQLLRT